MSESQTASDRRTTRPALPWSQPGILVGVDGSAEALQGRRIAVAVFLAACLVLALLFWPFWIGMPVESWFYRLHIWLPGWA